METRYKSANIPHRGDGEPKAIGNKNTNSANFLTSSFKKKNFFFPLSSFRNYPVKKEVCSRKHRERMNINLLVNLSCWILSSWGHVLFLTQRRKEGGSAPRAAASASPALRAAQAALLCTKDDVIFFTAGHVASVHAVTVFTRVPLRCPDPPPLEANGIPLAKAGLHLHTHACALALLGHMGDFFSCRKMTQAGML